MQNYPSDVYVVVKHKSECDHLQLLTVKGMQNLAERKLFKSLTKMTLTKCFKSNVYVIRTYVGFCTEIKCVLNINPLTWLVTAK